MIDLFTPERDDGLVWCLTGVVREDAQNYYYAKVKLLDMRPIDQLTQILAKHYTDPAKVKKLLSKGQRITHLAPELRECVIEGDPICGNSDPSVFGYSFHDDPPYDRATHKPKSWLSFRVVGEHGSWSSTRTAAIKPLWSESDERRMEMVLRNGNSGERYDKRK